MAERDAPYFKVTHDHEKNISIGDARRAIYIDFEGFEKKAPSLLGVACEDEFYQVVLDEELAGAADAKKIPYMSGKVLMESLLERACLESRMIVAYSAHEKEQCMKWYGLDISKYYVNANIVTKKWKKKSYAQTGNRITGLKDCLKLIGYERGDYLGVQQSTQRIKSVAEMLNRRGSYDALTPTTKAKWTKLLEHNKIDVEGMRYLILNVLL